MKEIATELKPYASPAEQGSTVWDRREYAITDEAVGVVGAAIWYVAITMMTALLEAQECAMSATQIKFLRHSLLGGMGSFNDFFLEPAKAGSGARLTNDHLNDLRGTLAKVLTV